MGLCLPKRLPSWFIATPATSAGLNGHLLKRRHVSARSAGRGSGIDLAGTSNMPVLSLDAIWLGLSKRKHRYAPRRPREFTSIARDVPTGLGPTALGKLWGVSRQRADQIVNRAKHQARDAVHSALEGGRLHKPSSCVRCHVPTADLEAHHDDYTKKLLVRWLCPPCHSIEHPHPAIFKNSPRERPCTRCGTPITFVQGDRSHRRLCKHCKDKTHQPLVNRICAQCGGVFQKARYSIRPTSPATYCSHRCSLIARFPKSYSASELEEAG